MPLAAWRASPSRRKRNLVFGEKDQLVDNTVIGHALKRDLFAIGKDL